MPTITVFTGSAGPGIATAAAASALQSATQGRRTLLISLGPMPSMRVLLGAAITGTPTEIAPNCDALAIDGLNELAKAWEGRHRQLPAGSAPIAGDELPLLPGLEMAFALLRLRELAPGYDAVMLDAGPYDMLLRALAAPDGLRWAVRLLFGLDRGSGRSSASVARALLPTTFIPIDTIDRVQDARVHAEQLRDLLIAPGAAAAVYVLSPDRPSLEEARIAIPALQLHALAVPTIAVGPLLPSDLDGTPLAAHAAAQMQLLADVQAIWPARQVQHFHLADSHGGRDALERSGEQLAPAESARFDAPIATEWAGVPAVAIELPGLPKNAMQLTLSGDELIVRVGGYRRHILLPEALRGISNIKATREGEYLIVRRRT
jgi:arsenite/tail-anchored protein-transporting ATPase